MHPQPSSKPDIPLIASDCWLYSTIPQWNPIVLLLLNPLTKVNQQKRGVQAAQLKIIPSITWRYPMYKWTIVVVPITRYCLNFGQDVRWVNHLILEQLLVTIQIPEGVSVKWLRGLVVPFKEVIWIDFSIYIYVCVGVHMLIYYTTITIKKRCVRLLLHSNSGIPFEPQKRSGKNHTSKAAPRCSCWSSSCPGVTESLSFGAAATDGESQLWMGKSTICICICIYIYAIFNKSVVKISSTTGGEPSMKNHICPFFHPSIYSFTCTSIKKENNIYLSI